MACKNSVANFLSFTDGAVCFETDLNIEFLKKGVDFKELYTSPFPLNSMNISKNGRVICGGDSGIVYCTEL